MDFEHVVEDLRAGKKIKRKNELRTYFADEEGLNANFIKISDIIKSDWEVDESRNISISQLEVAVYEVLRKYNLNSQAFESSVDFLRKKLGFKG